MSDESASNHARDENIKPARPPSASQADDQARQERQQADGSHRAKQQTGGGAGDPISSAGAAAAKPRIGDTRPAPVAAGPASSDSNRPIATSAADDNDRKPNPRRRRRRKPAVGDSNSFDKKASSGSAADQPSQAGDSPQSQRGGRNRNRNQNDGDEKRDGRTQSGSATDSGGRSADGDEENSRSRRRNRNRNRNRKKSTSSEPVSQVMSGEAVQLDEEALRQRRGRSRKGRPVGRYMMVVSKKKDATHIAVLEGRTLIEYYVSRPSDSVFQIHGNIYLGRVQNVLPGMEAAFVDIGTPKNAVIYKGDVQQDSGDVDGRSNRKIEHMLKARQSILCQVTKNPIAHKGARLTSEVSLPGRFVVLVPNSDTYGISKRLPDEERKRLRKILDKARPKGHGIIVRTAAENVTGPEIERDIDGLMEQWQDIEKLAKKSKAPSQIYQEPDMSTRVIREEFNKEYRSVVIDDRALYQEVADYVSTITPALADRVELYDASTESLPIFEKFHVHEQLHKALDRKVWLPSGGSLIIESTEALTVIDVNTGKNVGSSNLEDTVFRNNLEAAEGVAQQLRLRDIGGIIVIDFVDMESKKNRDEVMRVFRSALSRDKTRTQVFDISDLGLAEMTRKRIGEGLLESLSVQCPHCDGRGIEINIEGVQN